MDQEKVHIALLSINLIHAIEALLVRRLRTSPTAQDLCSEEERTSRDTRLSRSFPHFGLVAIELSRVYMAVASLEGGEARLDTDVPG